MSLCGLGPIRIDYVSCIWSRKCAFSKNNGLNHLLRIFIRSYEYPRGVVTGMQTGLCTAAVRIIGVRCMKSRPALTGARAAEGAKDEASSGVGAVTRRRVARFMPWRSGAIPLHENEYH